MAGHDCYGACQKVDTMGNDRGGDRLATGAQAGADEPPTAVTVRFLGTGDAFGSGGRLQACIWVEAGATRLLLDCGASSLIGLRRAGLEPARLDGVVLSHLHGDHFGGLPFLVLDAQFGHRQRPLVVLGPPGVEARVFRAMAVLFPGSTATRQRFELRFVELVERAPVWLGQAKVEAYGVPHASGAPAYALRLTCGDRVLAYSGDGEWSEALVEASQQADLFVCEAYFFDKAVRNHLSYITLAGQRQRLTCRRLVLTHLSQDMLSRRAEVQDEIADDGLEIVL
jgi:ribonuclease BN (tRNA processing enzyme)